MNNTTQKLSYIAHKFAMVGKFFRDMAALLSSPGDKVYLCDTFEGVVKAGDRDNAYHGGERRDTSRETVDSLLKSLGRILKDRVVLHNLNGQNR